MDILFSLFFIIMPDIITSLIIKRDLEVITDIFLSPPQLPRQSSNLANFFSHFFLNCQIKISFSDHIKPRLLCWPPQFCPGPFLNAPTFGVIHLKWNSNTECFCLKAFRGSLRSHRSNPRSWFVEFIHWINAELVPPIWLVPDPGSTWGWEARLYVFKKLPVMCKAMIIKHVTPFSSFASFPVILCFKITTAVALKCFRSYIHTACLHSFCVFLSWPKM